MVSASVIQLSTAPGDKVVVSGKGNEEEPVTEGYKDVGGGGGREKREGNLQSSCTLHNLTGYKTPSPKARPFSLTTLRSLT